MTDDQITDYTLDMMYDLGRYICNVTGKTPTSKQLDDLRRWICEWCDDLSKEGLTTARAIQLWWALGLDRMLFFPSLPVIQREQIRAVMVDFAMSEWTGKIGFQTVINEDDLKKRVKEEQEFFKRAARAIISSMDDGNIVGSLEFASGWVKRGEDRKKKKK